METEENTLVSKIKDWMMLHVTSVFRRPLPKVIHRCQRSYTFKTWGHHLWGKSIYYHFNRISATPLFLSLSFSFFHILSAPSTASVFFSSEYQMKFTPEIVNSLQGESLAHVNLTFVFKQTLGTCCTCLQCNTLCQWRRLSSAFHSLPKSCTSGIGHLEKKTRIHGLN